MLSNSKKKRMRNVGLGDADLVEQRNAQILREALEVCPNGQTI